MCKTLKQTLIILLATLMVATSMAPAFAEGAVSPDESGGENTEVSAPAAPANDESKDQKDNTSADAEGEGASSSSNETSDGLDTSENADNTDTPSDEPVTETAKGPKKAPSLRSAEGSTEGIAHAVVTADGELIFFRSNEPYYSNHWGTCTDIMGNEYTGVIYYKDMESADACYYENGSESTPWGDGRVKDPNNNTINVKSIRVADGQKICPLHFDYWFARLHNLKSISFEGFDTSNTISTKGMFCYSTSLEDIDLSGLDTSKVTDMAGMFDRCNALTSIDLSGLDTSKVTNMRRMFYGCTSLTALDVTSMDTSKVTNMSYMFYGCDSLQALDLSTLDTSAVMTMEYMFTNCKHLTSLTLGGSFDTSNVMNMSNMFNGCESLEHLDISFDTSKVTNMAGMFANCCKIASLDLSSFDTSKVTNMNAIFGSCYNLTDLDISSFNTSSTTNMSQMFSNCRSLKTLDLSHFDTSNVTNISKMFQNCYVLTDLDLSGFDTAKVTTMQGTFANCNALVSLDVSTWNTGLVTSMWDMFYNCTNLKALNVSSWDTSKVTDMNSMFSGCNALTSLDVSSFNTSNVHTMGSMFSGCSTLTSLDVSGFDTSRVTTMTYMFSECINLTSLDISNFNISNVTTMAFMFNHCEALASLNLTGIDTTNVQNMSHMFNCCYELTDLDVSNFNTSLVTSMTHMFAECKKLASLDLSSFDTSKVTDMNYMFNACTDLNSITLGEQFSFTGRNITNVSTKALLPPKKWMRLSTGDKYSSEELRDEWNGTTMADTYCKLVDVIFNATGGTVSPTSIETYIGSIFDVMPDASRNGYQFAGWYTAFSDGTQISAGDEITQTEYFAHWIPNIYMLVLDPNGGSGISVPVSLTYDQEYFAGQPFTKDGFVFDGWNTRKNGTGEQYDKADVISMLTTENGGTVTLYAQWTQDYCTVTFDSVGGNEVPPRIVKKGQPVGALFNSFREGYSFRGWYTSETGGNQLSTSQRINADTTYYAHWRENCIVAFDPNGGTVTEGTREVEYNTVVGELPVPERANYTFDGWYTALEGGTKISSGTYINGNATYYAHWKIRLNFDPNGGRITKDAIYTSPDAEVRILKSDNVSEDGSEYSGGYGNNKEETKIETFPGASKVYVRITYQTQSTSYDWVALYGSGITPSVSNYSSSVSNKLGGTSKATATFVIPGDTVQLFFKTNASTDSYYGYYAEVTNDPGTIGIYDPFTETPENYEINAFAEAVKDGYEFDGWYTSPAGGTKVEIGDVVDLTEKSTVYAHWKASETVTITYDSNGGSACAPQTIYKGQKIGALPIPTKANRVFRGWYPSPQPSRSLDGNTRVTEDTIIDEDVTLYARWNDTHTLTFNGNGYGSQVTRTVPDGETLNTLPGLRRVQYILEGWYPNADGTGEKLTTDTVISEDATYYAKWIPEMTDKTSGDLAYSYSATWSNASNNNVDNIANNLDFHPTDNQRQTATLHIRFEMNQAVDTVVPVGAVHITIPKSVFKGWDGQPVDTNNISSNLPVYPNKRNGMFFSYMDNGDSYILINNTELAGGAGLDATFSYYVYPNTVPGGAMDYEGNYLDDYDYYHDTFPITFDIDSDLDGTNETSDTVDLSLEMHTRVRSEQSKKCEQVYYRWKSEWGDKPIDADDYFYIEWFVFESITSQTNQPYQFSVSEDTVHDGTVIVLPPKSIEYGTTPANTLAKNFRSSVVTKHPISLLADIDENGKTFHNEAIVTEHWKSGYETSHIVEADTVVYGRSYPTGEWDKHYKGWPGGSNRLIGGQEDILDDNKDVNLSYELVYDGESNGQPVTWDEEARTYHAPERTILMRDGDPGDLLYSSGRIQQKYVWEPITGNSVLTDSDYYIKNITVNLNEYDVQQNNGLWTERIAHPDKTSYEPIEVWVRQKGESEYTRFLNIAEATTITLPNNTVGFEIRHKTSFYSTKMVVTADIYLKPTQRVKNFVRNDVSVKATSIIKNKAICRIWNGDDEEHPFFNVTNYKNDTSSAYKDLWELDVSTTGLRTRKYSSPETSTVFDVERGTQDTPMVIQGSNYNNASRKKKIESGVFYDLLPLGTSVDENTLFGVVYPTGNGGVSSVNTSTYNSKKANAINKNYYSVSFVDNWEGSGRTMMIINVGLPETVSASAIEFYYMLHNTYENVVDRGTTVENDVAFVNTSEHKTPYTTSKSGVINVIKEKEYYENLERRYGDDVAFAQASTHYIPVDAFSWGFHKSVMIGSSYDEEGTTIPNNEYTYRLSYSQSEYSKSDKIVFFDILEGGTETHPSQWYGVLKNINTNAAADMVSADNANIHCVPVIYYASKARNSFTGADWDVTNQDTWSTEKPADNADITAIAIDCSKGTGGADFVMKGKTAMNIYVTMQAPNGAENIGKSTTNEGISWARKFTGPEPEGEPTDEYSDATVTIKDTDEALHKTSNPETGTEEEPTGVIYGDVLTYTLSYTNNDEELTYRNVVLEDTIPTGLAVEKNNVSVYIGDSSNKVKIGNSARASMTADGQHLGFTLSEVLPGETVNIEIPTAVNVRKGNFVNQAKKISVNGYEKEVLSEKTYHAVIPATVNISKKVLGTGTMLPGATLQLLNSSNAVVEEWVSTDQPKSFVLGADSYTIHEVTPPEGYSSAEDIRFEINRAGEVICNTNFDSATSTISMYDKPLFVDVNISKTVTGDFGSKTGYFTVNVVLSGLTPSKAYRFAGRSGSFVASSTGTAETQISLKHGMTVTIKGLPSGATITATEPISSHVASYEATDDTGVICSGANTEARKAITTEPITLDVDHGNVTIAFTNNFDGVVPTGAARTSAALLVMFVITGALLIVYKKRSSKTNNTK